MTDIQSAVDDLMKKNELLHARGLQLLETTKLLSNGIEHIRTETSVAIEELLLLCLLNVQLSPQSANLLCVFLDLVLAEVLLFNELQLLLLEQRDGMKTGLEITTKDLEIRSA